MKYYLSLIIAYIFGLLTCIPILLIFLYLFNNTNKKKSMNIITSDALEEEPITQQSYFYKVGWLHVTREQYPTTSKNTSIGGIVKSYLSGNNNMVHQQDTPLTNNNQDTTTMTTYFAVLKFNTLYLYDSELQLDCRVIINLSNHSVHIYPYGLKDYELFSKTNRIHLKKKKSFSNNERDYYLNCTRCVDKEDWYVALKRASKLQHGEPALKDLQTSLHNTTHFDQDAMNHLISTIHSDPNNFELQWLNALLGRIFLGIYKTDTTKSFFYNKILSKIVKLNACRPPFLEEITVRSVDGGHGPPYITQPRLIHLSPQGEYTGDAHLFYDGHFRVELETVLKWKYSDRLPPIRIDLVLAITLKSIEGKIMFKIKEPPTNRIWLGFYKKPKMEWIVEPLVWEKRIGYSMVSKAIQTKIEEIITETMVLPNMDDMVFFQTEGIGGIYGKESTTAAEQEKSYNRNAQDASSLSYQSLPELYSSPSELVVSADPFPLLSTSVSSTVITPTKKRWFKRNNKSMHDEQELDENITSIMDTPSQQTLKSVIAPELIKKQGNPESRTKIKRVIISSSNSSSTNNRAQCLAANVDHSIQSLLLNTKHAETPTVKNSSSPPSLTNSSVKLNSDTNSEAQYSIRLSKQMLLLADQQPSRVRSKSLPSTGLSVDLAQMGGKSKESIKK